MPSNYQGFDLTTRNSAGDIVPIPNQTVEIYNTIAAADLAPTASNAAGFVPGATVSVAVGTKLRFRVENYQGLAMSITQITV